MDIELEELSVIEPQRIVDLLSVKSGLSKGRIKEAMNKGAVWLNTNGRPRRVRRAKATVTPGNKLSLYFSEDVLQQVPTNPMLIADAGIYSVWCKPAGLMSGGSRYGDHCAINRVIEKQLDRPTFLVHRLDRFVWGVMLLAHSKEAAANLSEQFQSRKTRKIYRGIVHGIVEKPMTLNGAIDSKDAVTHIAPLEIANDLTSLEITIETGRKHQIRRHLAAAGHPVIGDRQYGSDDKRGLQLASVSLSFNSPLDDTWVTCRLPEDQLPRIQEAN